MTQNLYGMNVDYERGKAEIIFGRGLIHTERAPQPVIFNCDFFSTIVTGQDVLFRRAPSDSKWADKVVAASQPDHFFSLAMSSNGMTPGAQAYVLSHAVRFAAQAERAPTAELAQDHVKFASETMKGIADMGNEKHGRLGVREVRSLLR